MTASTTKIATTMLAASLLAVGCSAGSTSPPGTVTRVFSVNARVAGADVGQGDTIQKGQHVITDIGGKLEFNIESAVNCIQGVSTDVIIAPSRKILLRNVSGSVTCGSTNGQNDQSVAAGHTLIYPADPVFTVVRQRDTTTLRVFYGSVLVTTTNPVGQANGSARFSAGQQVTIVDGQPPGPPESFVVSGLSAFEQQAAKSLEPNEPHSSSPSQATSSAAPLPQTIKFSTTAPRVVKPGSTYPVRATASSGLPVAIMIDRDDASAGICTMSGDTVTFSQRGVCVIDANQSGNATYQAAPQVQQKVTVE